MLFTVSITNVDIKGASHSQPVSVIISLEVLNPTTYKQTVKGKNWEAPFVFRCDTNVCLCTWTVIVSVLHVEEIGSDFNKVSFVFVVTIPNSYLLHPFIKGIL